MEPPSLATSGISASISWQNRRTSATYSCIEGYGFATAHRSQVPVHTATTKPIAGPSSADTPVPTTTHNAAPSSTSPYTHPHPLSYPLFYGNTRLPEVALTFDDGPNAYYTPQVLAILQHYRVQATFFDVGYLVRDFPNSELQPFCGMIQQKTRILRPVFWRWS